MKVTDEMVREIEAALGKQYYRPGCEYERWLRALLDERQQARLTLEAGSVAELDAGIAVLRQQARREGWDAAIEAAAEWLLGNLSTPYPLTLFEDVPPAAQQTEEQSKWISRGAAAVCRHHAGWMPDEIRALKMAII